MANNGKLVITTVTLRLLIRRSQVRALVGEPRNQSISPIDFVEPNPLRYLRKQIAIDPGPLTHGFPMDYRTRKHQAAHRNNSPQDQVPEMHLVHPGEPSLAATDEQLARL